MRQITFACQPSFEKHARPSRREQFLQTMETVVPWSELEALIEPHYPKAGNGRQPVGLSIMLRVYFLQHWFNLSDPGAEDALYDSPALRGFAGVDLGRACFSKLGWQANVIWRIALSIYMPLDACAVRLDDLIRGSLEITSIM